VGSEVYELNKALVDRFYNLSRGLEFEDKTSDGQKLRSTYLSQPPTEHPSLLDAMLYPVRPIGMVTSLVRMWNTSPTSSPAVLQSHATAIKTTNDDSLHSYTAPCMAGSISVELF
jgi:hypothetical protein